MTETEYTEKVNDLLLDFGNRLGKECVCAGVTELLSILSKTYENVDNINKLDLFDKINDFNYYLQDRFMFNFKDGIKIE